MGVGETFKNGDEFRGSTRVGGGGGRKEEGKGKKKGKLKKEKKTGKLSIFCFPV